MSETVECDNLKTTATVSAQTRVTATSMSAQAMLHTLLTGRLPSKLTLRREGQSIGRVEFEAGSMAIPPIREEMVNKLTVALAQPDCFVVLTREPEPSSISASDYASICARDIVDLYDSGPIEEDISALLERCQGRGATEPRIADISENRPIEDDISAVVEWCRNNGATVVVLSALARKRREQLKSEAVSALITKCQERAKQLLQEHSAAIAMLTDKLLEARELDADALRDLLSSL